MAEQQTTGGDLLTALQQLPFFAGLETQLIQRFAHSAIRRVYEPGAIIFLEGDDSPGLYYVQSGWVKAVSMSAEGREQILHFLKAGEVFGGMTVFVSQPMPATAIALEPTELWQLPRNVVRQALLTEPQFALRIIEYMGERINDLVALVADLSLRSVTARLARQLMENAVDDVVQRQRWATQAEMAARLGAAPDVVNRALRSLSDAGLIELSRQQIRILDRAGLADKALPDR